MTKKRAIFEDVQSAADAPQKAAPGMIDKPRRGRGGVIIWLVVLFVLVALMIVIGGLTRLTDSGLSITEWKPVTGALPPLNADQWAAEFELYKAIPEYQLQNAGMTLAEFKSIFWWEWGHRQLGRLIGLVWAVGYVGFLLSKAVPTGWNRRLLLIGLLGGFQGAIGWWMVSSGLTGQRVDVASYRLAVHLGLAFIILGLIAWYIFTLRNTDAELIQARRNREMRLLSLSTILATLAFIQILLGALVAGIDAGRGYTDWPLMAGQFFPADALDLAPVWRNFFENAGLVQFIHRMSAYLLLGAGLYVWRASRQSGNGTTRAMFNLMLMLLGLQMVLGIATVMTSATVTIALVHQIGAIVLWVVVLRARFSAHYPPVQTIKGNR